MARDEDILRMMDVGDPVSNAKVCERAVFNWTDLLMGGCNRVDLCGWKFAGDAVADWLKALEYWEQRAREEDADV